MEAETRTQQRSGATERADGPGALSAESGRSAKVEAGGHEAQLERLTAERDALRARLAEAEQELAAMPMLRDARAELESIHSSLSWRLTAPLRRGADAGRRELVPMARLAAKRALIRLAPRLRG